MLPLTFITLFQSDIDNIFELMLRFDNPIYYIIITGVVFTTVMYALIKYVIVPKDKQHKQEKLKIKDDSDRLLALFSELAPEAQIRIDNQGKIIQVNSASKILCNESCSDENNLIGKNINELIHTLHIGYDDFIKKAAFIEVEEKINDRFYMVTLKGIPSLNAIQLYFHDITEREAFKEKLKDLSQNIQEKIEEERQRIAKDLHDSVGQNLSLTRILIHKIETGNGSVKKEDYNKVNGLVDDVIKEIRKISYDLKPRVLDEMGLAPALTALCSDISEQTGLQIITDIKETDSRLDTKLEINLYRIAQEALNNVIKHAEATSIFIIFKRVNNSIRLSIIDNGKGFDEDEIKRLKPNSLGLMNIRQRVESLDGTFTLESNPNEGTVITVEIPFIEKAEIK